MKEFYMIMYNVKIVGMLVNWVDGLVKVLG